MENMINNGDRCYCDFLALLLGGDFAVISVLIC